MRSTTHLRIAVKEDAGAATKAIGRFISQHVSLREQVQSDFTQRQPEVVALIASLSTIDEWHEDAIIDIFTSELVTGMSNNIADYVWYELLPFRYDVAVLPPTPARSVREIATYIASFSNSSNLLKHVFAEELAQHCAASQANQAMLMLHKGVGRTRALTVKQVVDRFRHRANIRDCDSVSDDPLEAIIDTAFPELFFALRQAGRMRFSIASSADHSVALASPVEGPIAAIAKLRAAERRLTPMGEVVPSRVEYIALGATFSVSTAVLVLTLTLNWAKRINWLERVFDSVGLFSIVSAVLLAVVSRRLDFFDLLGIILRKKRYLESYAEMLSVLDVSEGELKSALTFEGVRVAPMARDCTSFAFEAHDGVFNTFSGLDSTVGDTNVIVGNKTTVARGESIVLYFDVNQNNRVCYLKPREDAMYRIVTDGDAKIVR